MTEQEGSPVPQRTGGPSTSWAHRELYDRVIDALHTLPARFQSSLVISGVKSTDLFTLNTALGAAIEDAVVSNLNLLRELWDPDDKYANYSFVRQAQVFPDVRLQTTAPGIPPEERVLLGIELKGWFILSKEGEPSFRYKVSPSVCAPQDLLVVYPWILSEVISGTPRLHAPLVDEARYAAEHRNHYWRVLRAGNGQKVEIKSAAAASPYPSKGTKFNDEAVSDSGGNFGRVARGGYMTDFIKKLLETEISGIQAQYWQKYLSIFAEGIDDVSVDRKLANMLKNARKDGLEPASEEALNALFSAMISFMKTQS